MKLALVTSLAVAAPAALAFAPTSNRATGRTQQLAASAFENEIGAQAPLGFYDPFNVVADDTAENFSKWREIELKHGRCVFVCACICSS